MTTFTVKITKSFIKHKHANNDLKNRIYFFVNRNLKKTLYMIVAKLNTINVFLLK